MRATPLNAVIPPSRRRAAATTLTIARNTASRRTISRDALMGRWIALIPITNAIVTIVEARAFPRAMSGHPSWTAIPLTRRWGRAEIVDTRSAPTTKRLRRIFPATPAALSVMNVAPWFRTRKPTTIAPIQRRGSRDGILRRIPSDGPRDGTGRYERLRAVAPEPAGSGDDLREPPRLGGAADLHRDPAARAHGPAPEGVSVGMADGHVDVRAPADPGRDVVDPEAELLVDGGLEREGPKDPGRVVLLGRLHVALREVERVPEARLPEGRAVVPDDDVLREALVFPEGQLLDRGDPHVPVEGRLEAPVDAEELHGRVPRLREG